MAVAAPLLMGIHASALAQAQQPPGTTGRPDSVVRVDSVRPAPMILMRDTARADTTDVSDSAALRDSLVVRGTAAARDTAAEAGTPVRADTLAKDTARTTDPVAVDSVSKPAAASAVPRAAPAARSSEPSEGKPVWPVEGPEPLPGSLLPHKRIVAYYGNPLSRRMGILGELPPDSMLKRLDAEVAAWEAADPSTPVQPALHLVTIVAQADPGPSGKYRALMSDSVIERVASWAETRGAIVFLDLQVGLSTLEAELPRIAKFLERPHFNLAIDPEFMMKNGSPPGKRLGYTTADDINYAVRFLADIVEKHDLPPKVLVVHRFTDGMLRNPEDIELDPRVQIVIHMDGWGPPRLKRDSYREYVYEQPVQFTGFKVFYKNDTRQGHPVMTPEQILTLFPRPLYIQYQ